MILWFRRHTLGHPGSSAAANCNSDWGGWQVVSMRIDKPISEMTRDSLRVEVYEDRAAAGRAAAAIVGERIRRAVARKGEANVVFAAAPSQNDFIESLLEDEALPWDKINCFHLDEYHTLPVGAPQRFDLYLQEHLWGKVEARNVLLLSPRDGMTEEEIEERYAALLQEHPLDVACIGIGENGHIAFNDPPVADFDDKRIIKEVELDEICRNQQVHDGAFDTLEAVPKTAMTMTIPAVMKAASICAIVPTDRKAEAVANTVNGPIDEACPASILRRHEDAVLILDKAAASRI
jgi:glucosamine-6-phosphate deaminase